MTGKPRSKYGRFMDRHGIKQEEIREITKLNKNTITKACSDDNAVLNGSTKELLAEAVRRLTGKENVRRSDFWDM